mmetsp:Transcript_23800/g.62280  ORF Transcript_23800/g.62280 Transcript_23800/m.62280 type:complete len:241 (+) Transcript_23800:129-851(+)
MTVPDLPPLMLFRFPSPMRRPRLGRPCLPSNWRGVSRRSSGPCGPALIAGRRVSQTPLQLEYGGATRTCRLKPKKTASANRWRGTSTPSRWGAGWSGRTPRPPRPTHPHPSSSVGSDPSRSRQSTWPFQCRRWPRGIRSSTICGRCTRCCGTTAGAARRSLCQTTVPRPRRTAPRPQRPTLICGPTALGWDRPTTSHRHTGCPTREKAQSRRRRLRRRCSLMCRGCVSTGSACARQTRGF